MFFNHFSKLSHDFNGVAGIAKQALKDVQAGIVLEDRDYEDVFSSLDEFATCLRLLKVSFEIFSPACSGKNLQEALSTLNQSRITVDTKEADLNLSLFSSQKFCSSLMCASVSLTKGQTSKLHLSSYLDSGSLLVSLSKSNATLAIRDGVIPAKDYFQRVNSICGVGGCLATKVVEGERVEVLFDTQTKCGFLWLLS